MIPFHERLINRLKKAPLIKLIKDIPPLKRISRVLRNRNIEKRRKLVNQYGYELLEKVYLISKEIDSPIWIDWGTILGYVREGRILEHDYDLDVSTWRMTKEEHDFFQKAIEKHGFSLVRSFLYGEEIMTETFEYKGVLIDVEYYWLENGIAYTYSFDTDARSKIIDNKEIQTIEGMNIYIFSSAITKFTDSRFINGTPCIIPVEPERRVIEAYGKNWKKPDKNYDWKSMSDYEMKGFCAHATGWRKF